MTMAECYTMDVYQIGQYCKIINGQTEQGLSYCDINCDGYDRCTGCCLGVKNITLINKEIRLLCRNRLYQKNKNQKENIMKIVLKKDNDTGKYTAEISGETLKGEPVLFATPDDIYQTIEIESFELEIG